MSEFYRVLKYNRLTVLLDTYAKLNLKLNYRAFFF